MCNEILTLHKSNMADKLDNIINNSIHPSLADPAIEVIQLLGSIYLKATKSPGLKCIISFFILYASLSKETFPFISSKFFFTLKYHNL